MFIDLCNWCYDWQISIHILRIWGVHGSVAHWNAMHLSCMGAALVVLSIAFHHCSAVQVGPRFAAL